MSLKEFKVVSKLGSGSFAQVFKCVKVENQKEYALKKVNINQMKERDQQNALNEVRLLASIKDPFIIQYKQAFVDKEHETLCIVMEYADSGDLKHLL